MTSFAPVHVFFIRGLSTNGSDDAYWSVFRFGPMARHFAAAFAQRGIEFHPINGMGSGSLTELAAKVRDLLERHPVWRDPSLPVHILGHSAGGLVARLLCAQTGIPPGKIQSVMTVATPNLGSGFAEHCLTIPEKFPLSDRFLKTFGYDIAGKKRGSITDLTPEKVQATMREHARIAAGIRQASIICWAPRREWCLPLKLFYIVPAFNAFTLPSDGMVERDSQAFGDVVAEINIDHFRQIGIFGRPEKFLQLCDTLANFYLTFSAPK
jgi:pimeloyl-ACP methyl ester carboxylesterase